jgi:hypothetical protein
MTEYPQAFLVTHLQEVVSRLPDSQVSPFLWDSPLRAILHPPKFVRVSASKTATLLHRGFAVVNQHRIAYQAMLPGLDLCCRCVIHYIMRIPLSIAVAHKYLNGDRDSCALNTTKWVFFSWRGMTSFARKSFFLGIQLRRLVEKGRDSRYRLLCRLLPPTISSLRSANIVKDLREQALN